MNTTVGQIHYFKVTKHATLTLAIVASYCYFGPNDNSTTQSSSRRALGRKCSMFQLRNFGVVDVGQGARERTVGVVGGMYVVTLSTYMFFL